MNHLSETRPIGANTCSSMPAAWMRLTFLSCVVACTLPGADSTATNAAILSEDPVAVEVPHADKPSRHAHPDNLLGLGPLRISSQSPGQSLRLGLIPHTPQDLAAGEWKLYAGGSWVNVWAEERQYALDYEALTCEALVSYGINGAWAIEVGALSRVTFGGRMDGMIQGFHDLFGIDQSGRDDVPPNRTSIRIDPNASQPGVLLDAEDLQNNRLTFLRGAVLWTLYDGHNGWPATALACTLQAPVGERRGYSGGLLDVSLDLSFAKPLGDWVLYGSAAWTRFAANEVYGIHLHRSNWAGLAAIEYRATRNWSLVLQYLLSQGVAPDLYVFSKPSNEVTLGTQVRVGKHTILQLGLIENVFIFDNSPDFGVHLALEMRL